MGKRTPNSMVFPLPFARFYPARDERRWKCRTEGHYRPRAGTVHDPALALRILAARKERKHAYIHSFRATKWKERCARELQREEAAVSPGHNKLPQVHCSPRHKQNKQKKYKGKYLQTEESKNNVRIVRGKGISAGPCVGLGHDPI